MHLEVRLSWGGKFEDAIEKKKKLHPKGGGSPGELYHERYRIPTSGSRLQIWVIIHKKKDKKCNIDGKKSQKRGWSWDPIGDRGGRGRCEGTVASGGKRKKICPGNCLGSVLGGGTVLKCRRGPGGGKLLLAK